MTAITDHQHADDRVALRRYMRQRRRQLSPIQQTRAAQGIVRQLMGFGPARFRRRWAVYISQDGEIDPRFLCAQLKKYHRELFLPMLRPGNPNRLYFARYHAATRMVKNKYSIPEPSLKHSKPTATWTLSVICLPLVAFDSLGNRLGMGGGYYDRSLANQRLRIKKPLLIGTAHHFQEVSKLSTASWDIGLSAIATDRSIIGYQQK